MATSDTKWWKNYRRTMYKPSIKMTKERIFRASLREVTNEYTRHSLIPCIKNFFLYYKLLERISWGLLSLILSTTLAVLINNVRASISITPFLVSMESSVYPLKNINFPGVALCNVNRISKRVAKTYAKNHLSNINASNRTPVFSLEELAEILQETGNAITLEAPSERLKKFMATISVEAAANYDVVEIMKKMAPTCKKMLLRCTWHGKIYPCEELYILRRTSHGHCCCFNYDIEFNSNGRPMNFLTKKIKRQKISGYSFGLSVVLDSELDDYAYPIRNNEGIDVLIFQPTHYPDHNSGFISHQIVNTNLILSMELKARIQIATSEVRKYPVNKRKCLFSDERPEEYGNMYSYSSCITSCRIRTVLSLCRCVPYFFPVPINTTKMCTMFDLMCLSKFKEKLFNIYPLNRQSDDGLDVELQDAMYCPECLPDCEFTKYYTKTSVFPHNEKNLNKRLPNHLSWGLDLTNRSVVNIYFNLDHGILDKLDVATYWYEAVGIIGGMAALIFGLSVMVWAEIIYYYTVRLFIVMWEKNNETNLRYY